MWVIVAFAGSLIWAVLPAFPARELRHLYRSGLLALYVAVAFILSNLYAWHLRPNLGSTKNHFG
ncbi:MAG: hypothetical protein WCO56_03780 [Verrucomicrobiota bacterium]